MSLKRIMLNPYQKRESCCFGCEKRTAECHSICEDYRNERKERDKYYEDIKKERELNYVDAERATNKVDWFRKAGSRK